MRIVLDTNVYVSALLGRGGPSGVVLALIKQHQHTLVTSFSQIDELKRVLARRRISIRIPAREAAEFVDYLDSVANLVEEAPAIRISADPDDDAILATAVAGHADLIVSGDKRHMLSLGEVQGIPIVSPRDALSLISK